MGITPLILGANHWYLNNNIVFKNKRLVWNDICFKISQTFASDSTEGNCCAGFLCIKSGIVDNLTDAVRLVVSLLHMVPIFY